MATKMTWELPPTFPQATNQPIFGPAGKVVASTFYAARGFARPDGTIDIFVGEYNPRGVYNTNFINFNPAGDWSASPSVFAPNTTISETLGAFKAQHPDGRQIVGGGISNAPSQRRQVYVRAFNEDLKKNRIAHLPTLTSGSAAPGRFRSAAAMRSDGALFIVGGADGTSYARAAAPGPTNNITHVLVKPATPWATSTPAPRDFHYAGYATVNDVLWIIGGIAYNPANKTDPIFLGDIHKLDLWSQQWTTITNPSGLGSGGCEAAYSNGHIYVLFGYNSGEEERRFVRINVSDNSIETLPALPYLTNYNTTQDFLDLVAGADGHIYVLGGAQDKASAYRFLTDYTRPTASGSGFAGVSLRASGAALTRRLPTGTGHATITVSGLHVAAPGPGDAGEGKAAVVLSAAGDGSAGRWAPGGTPGVDVDAHATLVRAHVGTANTPMQFFAPRSPARVSPVGRGGARIAFTAELGPNAHVLIAGTGASTVDIGARADYRHHIMGFAEVDLNASASARVVRVGLGRRTPVLFFAMARGRRTVAADPVEAVVRVRCVGSQSPFVDEVQTALTLNGTLDPGPVIATGKATAAIRLRTIGRGRVANEAAGDAVVSLYGWAYPETIWTADALVHLTGRGRGYVVPSRPRDVRLDLAVPTRVLRLALDTEAVTHATARPAEVV